MYSDRSKGKDLHYFSEKCSSQDLPFLNLWASEIFLSCVQLKVHGVFFSYENKVNWLHKEILVSASQKTEQLNDSFTESTH